MFRSLLWEMKGLLGVADRDSANAVHFVLHRTSGKAMLLS